MDKEIIRQVRADLKAYTQQQRNIEAWTRELHELAARRDAIAVPASPSLTRRGGGSHESIVERQAERRERMEERMENIRLDIDDARLFLWRIDNALDALSDDDRKVLHLYYINRSSWYSVADSMFLSYDAARRRGDRAICKLARLLYHIPATIPSAPALAV